MAPKHTLPGLLLALAATASWGSEYEPLNYFGISFLQLEESRAGGPDYRPNGVLARLGFMGGDHFGLELQTGLSQTGNQFELRNVTGAYLYAGIPYERLTSFALAGMAHLNVKNAGKSEANENLSFGFGIRWRATDAFDIGAEWMNYATRQAYKVNALSIGFIKHF